MNILDGSKTYTFSDYFKLPYPTSEILAELGYDYAIAPLGIPVPPVDTSWVTLASELEQKQRNLIASSETAIREFYVAPMMLKLMDHIQFTLAIEYTVNVSERLRGVVDYVLRGQQSVVVIEAKEANIDRGFTQLAVEMIAVAARYDESIIYGAVTTGLLWRFGRFDGREITRDTDVHLLPHALPTVAGSIMSLLGAE
ncbi:MAG: hypothetical protein AAF702_48800 [Chloroflexota bacterium]